MLHRPIKKDDGIFFQSSAPLSKKSFAQSRYLMKFCSINEFLVIVLSKVICHIAGLITHCHAAMASATSRVFCSFPPLSLHNTNKVVRLWRCCIYVFYHITMSQCPKRTWVPQRTWLLSLLNTFNVTSGICI